MRQPAQASLQPQDRHALRAVLLERTKSPRLELGNSLRGFMAELGLNSSNGSSGAKRSDARRLRGQMERLFRARISFENTGTDRDRRDLGL